MQIVTPIIPVKQHFYNVKTNFILDKDYNYAQESLDLKSICFFAATGFFFDDQTFYENVKLLPSASVIDVKDNCVVSVENYWKWYYNPIFNNLKDATEAFKAAFEDALLTNIKNRKVILPLSGGIDSRTIAAAIPDGTDGVHAYSYMFSGGINEIAYGSAIAEIKKFPFSNYEIPSGYLWDHIDELYNITQLYNEFTHSRQMAVISEVEKLGDLFVLGHGGEIFKAPTVKDHYTCEKLVDIILKMSIKQEGLELGNKLWQSWGLTGNFYDYMWEMIAEPLKKISIESINSKLRIFFYKHIVTRRSQVNINVFARNKEILNPFLEQNVLDMMCSTREDLLEDRMIQIEYIKQKSPALASIPWQIYSPLNLYNFSKINNFDRLPYRSYKWFIKKLNEKFFSKKLILRNWELQFLGEENDKKLRNYLFDETINNGFIPFEISKEYYQKFKTKDPVNFAHPICMLLTLQYFNKKRANLKDKAVLNGIND
ncbi:hypothetical protein BH23BAC1_BH23BAC1_47460 [soil metagenome]